LKPIDCANELHDALNHDNGALDSFLELLADTKSNCGEVIAFRAEAT